MYVNLCWKFITMWCALNVVILLPSRASVCCFEAVPCLLVGVWRQCEHTFEMPCCREADEKMCGTKGGSRVGQVAWIPSKKKKEIRKSLTSCASQKAHWGFFSQSSVSLDPEKWHFASSVMGGSPPKALLASLTGWKPWPWLELVHLWRQSGPACWSGSGKNVWKALKWRPGSRLRRPPDISIWWSSKRVAMGGDSGVDQGLYSETICPIWLGSLRSHQGEPWKTLLERGSVWRATAQPSATLTQSHITRDGWINWQIIHSSPITEAAEELSFFFLPYAFLAVDLNYFLVGRMVMPLLTLFANRVFIVWK